MWRVFRTFLIPSTIPFTEIHYNDDDYEKPTDLETTGRAHTQTHRFIPLRLTSVHENNPLRLVIFGSHTHTHTHAPAHVYNIMLSDGQASRFHHIPLSPSTVPDKTIAKLAPLENAYYIMVYIFSVRVLYQSA